MKPYLYAAVGLTVIIGLSTLYYKGYSDGKFAVTQRLQNDRITVLKDGKRIDENVLAADDDALYCLLTDCESD